MMEDKVVATVANVIVAIIVLGLITYGVLEVQGAYVPHSLPQRILPLPAPEQVGDLTGGKKIIYAKEPLSFKGPLGTYVVQGYLKASQSLNNAIGVYVRAKDPADDSTCKVLNVTSQVQSGVLESSVYVCERGEADAKATVAEFRNTSFASFCSSDPEAFGVVTQGRQGKFWIGVEWDPFLPHPLSLTFDNLAAIKGPKVPFASSPCTFDSR